MNKHLWIFGFAAASVLAGCSGDDETLSPGSEAADGGVGVEAPVEIRLSSGAAGTRASLESDDAGLFEADGLGIFCLAHGSLSVNPNELPIDWSYAYGSEPNYSAWLDNVEANAVYEKNAEGVAVATNIVWADGQRRWYPVGNWYSYHFYGYYPRVEDYMVTAGSRQRIASIPIDGTQDIIWGRTTSADPMAYCAKYFRQAGRENEIPSLAFSHRLMRLTFSCVPGEDARGSIESAKKMGVMSIAVKSVPTVANLIVADLDDTSNEGTVYYDWTNNVADFLLKDSLDADFREDHWVQENETTLGQGILLPVPDAEMAAAGFRYLVEITLMDRDGNVFRSEHPIELQNSAVYQAGKSYNVKLTVHGPQEIYLNATLAPWEIDDDNIGGVTL